MSKLTSRTQLKSHNRHLKQQMQVVKKKAKQEVASIKWDYEHMKWIQKTWIWKIYCFFKKPKYA